MLRIYGVSDAAFRIHTQDERIYEITSRDWTMFAECQNRGDHGTCRVNDVTGMGVIVIENVRADTVDQSGIQDVEPLFSAKDARLRRSGKGAHCGKRDTHSFVTGAAKRASNPIQKGTCRFLQDRSRKLRGFGGYDVARQ